MNKSIKKKNEHTRNYYFLENPDQDKERVEVEQADLMTEWEDIPK